MSVAGVEVEVGGYAISDIGHLHGGGQAKALSSLGSVDGDGFSSAQSAPHSFFSNWQSQLAKLSAATEPVTDGSLATESTPESSPNFTSPGLSVASKLTSKLAPPIDDSTGSVTIGPQAAAEKPISTSLQPKVTGSRQTSATRDGANHTSEHTSKFSALHPNGSARPIERKGADLTQQPTADLIADLSSPQTAPLAISITSRPDGTAEKSARVTSESQHSETFQLALDADRQKGLRSFPVGRESISSRIGINGGAGYELSQEDIEPTLIGEHTNIASNQNSASSLIQSRVSEPTLVDPSARSTQTSTSNFIAGESPIGQENQAVNELASSATASRLSQSSQSSDPNLETANEKLRAKDSISISQEVPTRRQGSATVSLTSFGSSFSAAPSRASATSQEAFPQPSKFSASAEVHSEDHASVQTEDSPSTNQGSPDGADPLRLQIDQADAGAIAMAYSTTVARKTQPSNANDPNHGHIAGITPANQPSIKAGPIAAANLISADPAIAPEPESYLWAGQQMNLVSSPLQSADQQPALSQAQPATQPLAQVAKPKSVASSPGQLDQALDQVETADPQPHTIAPKASANSASFANSRATDPTHTTHATAPNSLANPFIHQSQMQTSGAVSDLSTVLRDPAGSHSNSNADADARSSLPSNPAPSARETFASLDSTELTGTPTWVHAGSHRAEAGFQDPSLGWVGVRADTSGGQVHATLVPASAEGVQQLGGHLAGLHGYLTETHTQVDSLTLAKPDNGELPFSTAQDQSQGMHQDAQQSGGQGSTPEASSGSATHEVTSTGSSEVHETLLNLANPSPVDYWRSGVHISVVA